MMTNEERRKKNSLRMSVWRKEHPNAVSITSAKWYKTHADAKKTATVAWKAAHPGYAAAATAKSRKAHPEVHIEWNKNNPGYMNSYRKTKQEKLAGRPKPKTCELCGHVSTQICFDHCHKSGLFRGWLCHTCNLALGYAKDSPKLLRKMAVYLETASQDKV
jgi:hypothetical protein